MPFIFAALAAAIVTVGLDLAHPGRNALERERSSAQSRQQEFASLNEPGRANKKCAPWWRCLIGNAFVSRFGFRFA